MPTPGGLPKAGDRIMWVPEQLMGTVVSRGGGDYFSLTILWDGDRTPKKNVDAAGHIAMGLLKLEVDDASG